MVRGPKLFRTSATGYNKRQFVQFARCCRVRAERLLTRAAEDGTASAPSCCTHHGCLLCACNSLRPLPPLLIFPTKLDPRRTDVSPDRHASNTQVFLGRNPPPHPPCKPWPLAECQEGCGGSLWPSIEGQLAASCWDCPAEPRTEGTCCVLASTASAASLCLATLRRNPSPCSSELSWSLGTPASSWPNWPSRRSAMMKWCVAGPAAPNRGSRPVAAAPATTDRCCRGARRPGSELVAVERGRAPSRGAKPRLAGPEEWEGGPRRPSGARGALGLTTWACA